MAHSAIAETAREAFTSFVPARTDATAEWLSFQTQFTQAAERRKLWREASEEEKQAALYLMEDKYQGCPAASNSWSSFENFSDLLDDLDMDSSPGYPYTEQAMTNGQWLRVTGIRDYDPIRVRMLWYDVQAILAGEMEHIFRVFVKDEPHKKEKADANRWRLIIASSLPMQMIWRMLFKHQNEWLNAQCWELPSSHGMVFCYGGWRRFKSVCKTRGLIYSSDVSGWDINVPGWIFDCVKELRKRWGGPPDWMRTIDLVYDDAYKNSKLYFSNGIIVQQLFGGFMKSGLFNTITDNSLGGGFLHIVASLRSGQPVGNWIVTGDDMMRQYMSDTYLDQLLPLGVRLKEYSRNLDFMGMNFDDKPKPNYFQKHIVKCATSPEHLGEILDAYARLYCFDPVHDNYWRDVAHQYNISLHSTSYYQFWFSSPLARLLNPWK
nr:hypothetical protein [Leuven Luteo-like virus 1]